MLEPSIFPLDSFDRLEALREVDLYRPWNSIDDERRCLQCGQIISGRDIHLSRADNGAGSWQAHCPTAGCAAIPLDWALVHPHSVLSGVETAREPDRESRQPRSVAQIN